MQANVLPELRAFAVIEEVRLSSENHMFLSLLLQKKSLRRVLNEWKDRAELPGLCQRTISGCILHHFDFHSLRGKQK